MNKELSSRVFHFITNNTKTSQGISICMFKEDLENMALLLAARDINGLMYDDIRSEYIDFRKMVMFSDGRLMDIMLRTRSGTAFVDCNLYDSDMQVLDWKTWTRETFLGLYAIQYGEVEYSIGVEAIEERSHDLKTTPVEIDASEFTWHTTETGEHYIPWPGAHTAMVEVPGAPEMACGWVCIGGPSIDMLWDYCQASESSGLDLVEAASSLVKYRVDSTESLVKLLLEATSLRDSQNLGGPFDYLLVTMPDGSRVTARTKEDTDYPGIAIQLQEDNNEARDIAWVEFNKDRKPSDGQIRVLAWSDGEDEPGVNFSIQTGTNDVK